MKLKPHHVWADCLCAEIDPADRPCIVCESKAALRCECGADAGAIEHPP